MSLNRRQILLNSSAALAALSWPSFALGQSDSKPITIGALNPITGSGSPYGTGMQQMIIAAAEHVNAAGGILGRQVKIIAEDDQSNAQAAVLAAKKLIEINGVQAILGTWASGVTLAVLPLCTAANLPLMHTSGAPSLSTIDVNPKRLGFRFSAPNTQIGNVYATVCEREQFKRVAVMALNNASGLGQIEAFKAAWKAKGNDIVAEVVYEPSQSSYRSELMKVLDAKPDVIVGATYYVDTTIIIREWFQTGATNKWLVPGWAATPEFVEAVGPDVAEGVMCADYILQEDAPGYELYDTAYRTRMGAPGNVNIYAGYAWDMMQSLAIALEASKSEDMANITTTLRDAVNPPGEKVYSFSQAKEAIAAGHKVNYEGVSSSLDFDEANDVRTESGVYVIKSGKLTKLYTVKP